MCTTCCAAVAIKRTSIGEATEFRWNPKATRWQLLNNPDAPPVDNLASTVPAGWPSISVEATGETEGPGRVRFRLPAAEWTDWIDVYDVASAMGTLDVDMRWDAIPKDHPIRGGDQAALLSYFLRRMAEGAARRAGAHAARALVHAGKLSQKRGYAYLEKLRAGERPDGIDHGAGRWVEGFLREILSATVRQKRAMPRIAGYRVVSRRGTAAA